MTLFTWDMVRQYLNKNIIKYFSTLNTLFKVVQLFIQLNPDWVCENLKLDKTLSYSCTLYILIEYAKPETYSKDHKKTLFMSI